MAAVLGRTQLQIKKTGIVVTIPNDPIAKLMYYFDCVCTCVEADDDYDIRRLRDYRNYSNLSSQEEAQLLVLCAALSPDKLVGTIFFLAEDSTFSESSNEFFELSQVDTKMVITESLLIGGQQKRIRKIMMFKKSWIEKNYLNPLRAAIERGKRPPAPATTPSYTPRPPVPVATPPSQPYTRPVTRQPYTSPVTTGGPYTHQVEPLYSNDAGGAGIGGLVFGVCTTLCLTILGCWWALPCSITAIVLGIISSSNSGYNSSASTQKTCSILCSVCSWVTAALGFAAILSAFLYLNASSRT